MLKFSLFGLILFYVSFCLFKAEGQVKNLGVGPHNFEYLLGESTNFSTTASIVVVDYDVSARTIQSLKSQGKRVICYVSVGSWENWRNDKDAFPASVLGKDYEGWPGEKWLDIRQVDTLMQIMTKRFQTAANKGCQGIDPDNMAGFENDTGFNLRPRDQLVYNRAISRAVRNLGLLCGLKNDGTQARQLVNSFDFVVVESCVKYNECDSYDVFIRNSKPVLAVEYIEYMTEADFKKNACPLVRSKKYSLILKKLNLRNDYTVKC